MPFISEKARDQSSTAHHLCQVELSLLGSTIATPAEFAAIEYPVTLSVRTPYLSDAAMSDRSLAALFDLALRFFLPELGTPLGLLVTRVECLTPAANLPPLETTFPAAPGTIAPAISQTPLTESPLLIFQIPWPTLQAAATTAQAAQSNPPTSITSSMMFPTFQPPSSVRYLSLAQLDTPFQADSQILCSSEETVALTN